MTILMRLLTLQIRKQKRHNAKDGVYVVYGQSLAKHQINNISMGGLSFYYVDTGRKFDRSVRDLSLFNRKRVCLERIAFKSVSDMETGKMLFRNNRVKRQSVRFEKLTPLQKKQLKAFISSFTE